MDPVIGALSPEERMSQRRCPECGESVTRHSARHHRVNHWPQPLYREDARTAEAFKRAQLLDDFATAEDAAFNARSKSVQEA